MRTRASSSTCRPGARSCASPRPTIGGFSWIAGAYLRAHRALHLHRQHGRRRRRRVPRVYQQPLLDPPIRLRPTPSATFLADSQNNNAWAVFGDATYEFNKQWELDAAIRYDEDSRQNTTDTPPPFLAGIRPPSTARCASTPSSEMQPKGTLRYKPTRQHHLLRRLEPRFPQRRLQSDRRGRGGARQAISACIDLFNAEVADTWEVGAKGQFLDRRLNAGLTLYPHQVAQRLLLRLHWRRTPRRTSATWTPPTRAWSSS